MELCTHYGISRKTGYKWIGRAEADGHAHLAEQSRRPHTCPHATPEHLVTRLLEARRRHPRWGPRKLLKVLRRRDRREGRSEPWPARSTVADLFRRHGLITPRRRRRFPGHPGPPLTPMTAPNVIWTADFKGQFRTTNGLYCYPLTAQDGFSRYLLVCRGLSGTTGAESRPIFERLFREYGLPEILRTDNGVPFATDALHRLSQLSVWWIRLGIQHQRIHPASPQENGAHERMHRTLKAGACRPPRANLAAQQRAFNRFRTLYNDERPDEFRDGRTPSSCYTASPRPFPEHLPPLEYPGHFLVKRVTNAGTFRLKHKLLFIANALKQYPIGLEETDDGIWSIYFGTVLLAKVDERDMILRD